ncbi:hypothetical protein IU500_24630 [Nocardia terpenica]|uniref:hypothetical protein n=1 Tax=Nocardia terpenica TaxID=455432 RepID=UPI001892F160|nr:hypothetical protein [Nocardia terpenica]MBF6064687.1 hypothetical protein [Nocardia terpenica]MBF6107203.1 hypothetical protein [Nocardia terpenica]MBF6114961.1 hypothetical protein [Nocardia terpenica]MBF6122066.1 hypothetical protein [Nocardia terpenica]MBF6154449.1 hypothetical protein [Nocardia terpenica]
MHCTNTIRFLITFAAAASVSVVVGCGSSAHHPAAPEHPDLHAAPTHLRWVGFQGVQVPVSDQGPKHLAGPIATGYDPSPAGAALAAIESTVRMSVAADNQWAQVGQQLLAPGPGRDRWATARVQVSITDPVPVDAAPRVVGYAVTDYTPARADVAVFTRQGDGSLTRNAATVVRHADTWLLQLAAKPGQPPVTAVTRTPPDIVALLSASKGSTR